MSRSELRLPALEVRQGKRRLYQFAIDGKRLADISTVSRIHRDEDGQIGGYQRPEVLRHVKAIRDYLESPGALMPNAHRHRVRLARALRAGPRRRGSRRERRRQYRHPCIWLGIARTRLDGSWTASSESQRSEMPSLPASPSQS